MSITTSPPVEINDSQSDYVGPADERNDRVFPSMELSSTTGSIGDPTSQENPFLPQHLSASPAISNGTQQTKPPPPLTGNHPIQAQCDQEIMSMPPPSHVYLNGHNGHRMSPRPTRESVLRRLSEALLRRSLTVIDMSQRDLVPSDSKLIKIAVMQNVNLHTLKLAYNHLGDEGLITLAPALAHSNIQSLDLGFTGVGDMGMEALANAFLQGDVRATSNLLTKQRQRQIRQSKLDTLYLSGNCITTRGCLALSKMIQFGSCKLEKLHLTGNRIGVDGVRSLTRALALPVGFGVNAEADDQKGIQELFLGGTGIGSEGCHAVAEMLSSVRTLRILSLADNNLGDRECNILSDAIKKNRNQLPLEALQLSFNHISCVGVESLMNAVWGSPYLHELRLDNNCIADRGAQLIAVVVANVPSLSRLDVGFNNLTALGMRALMKSIAESEKIVSLSISGNKLDTDGAKAVAYALAYNRSLKYFFMDNCAANHYSQRHITAGIVSNSQVALHTITGFRIGAVAVTLGLPSALEQLTNDQVLKFILLMWEQNRFETEKTSNDCILDPLNFLPSCDEYGSTNGLAKATGNHSDNSRFADRKPLDPATVVAVAKRAYESLGGDGNLAEAASRLLQYTPKDGFDSREPSLDCPLVEDAIMIEADSVGDNLEGEGHCDVMLDLDVSSEVSSLEVFHDHKINGLNGYPRAIGSNGVPSLKPSVPRTPRNGAALEETGRKRRNVDWLCHNIKNLHQLAQMPFNSTELWRLHQHFSALAIQIKIPHSTKVDGDEISTVNSISAFSSPDHAMESLQSECSIMQRPNSIISAPCNSSSPLSFQSEPSPPFSEISLPAGSGSPPEHVPQHSTINGTLGRKVSYRSLNDALLGGAFPTAPVLKDRGRTISTVVEDGCPTPQPRNKRPRQNRSRISHFPRMKAKLESLLQKDHHKALVLMRQLHYTEQQFLNMLTADQQVSDSSYLSRECTKDIETILIDMM